MGKNLGSSKKTGICSDGQKLAEIFPGARFIFPTAKRRQSSAYGRAKLTQWFDIASLDDSSHRSDTQLKGLAESSAEILDLINEEVLEIPRNSIIIGGLSHGCAMALSCLLALDFSLGCFIGMSGWLPFQHDIEELLKTEDGTGGDEDPFGFDDDDPFSTDDGAARGQQDAAIEILNSSRNLLCFTSLSNPTRDTTSIPTPIFLGHGDADEKIKPSLGDLHFAGRTTERVVFKIELKDEEGYAKYISIEPGYEGKINSNRPKLKFARQKMKYDA
ncbi:acyl-protein thioesterase [Jackrogersella minutella]|nr:acyl-protein thioesterase [Jackrogersella minutella]